MQPTLPNKSASQRPTIPFNAAHHRVYETLRQHLMQLHQQGVPGIDNILHALNKEHVNQMTPQSPQMPVQ